MFDCMPSKKIYLSFYKNLIKVKIGIPKNIQFIKKHYIHNIFFQTPNSIRWIFCSNDLIWIIRICKKPLNHNKSFWSYFTDSQLIQSSSMSIYKKKLEKIVMVLVNIKKIFYHNTKYKKDFEINYLIILKNLGQLMCYLVKKKYISLTLDKVS